MIETKNLTKQFKNITAVNNLNLKIDKGVIFGFIGPNGAGKTTTIKMLSTLLKPTSGEAYIAGYNVFNEPDAVRKVIGYMPDFFGVYDDMKVWEYLDFFSAAYKIEKSKRKQIVDDVLVLTDLQHKRDEFVDTLSRGMKQRLCLAKTLVHDPLVLLLDEPASGLDPRARIEMRELLKELKKMGKTILISSHILTELQDFCDQIGIIEKGELLVSGNVEDIVEQIKGNSVYLIKVKDEWNRAKEILEKIQGVQRVTFIYESGKLVEGETPPESLSVELVGKSDDPSLLLETLITNKISVLSCTERQTDLEDIFMKITKGVVG